MLETLWNVIFGNLDMVKVSALIAAASFCWEKAVKWRASKRVEKAQEISDVITDAVNQAIYLTSSEIGNLGKTRNIPEHIATELLSTATKYAEQFASARGVNLREVLKDQEAIRGLVQGAFSEINASLKEANGESHAENNNNTGSVAPSTTGSV